MDISYRHALVVDDEPDSLRVLGRLLSQEGYRVHLANSGESALDIAETIGGEIRLDVILLDILMPGGIDGVETCRRLKALATTSETPIIFLTGKNDVPTAVAAFEAGGADFVPKPFDARILLTRVRTHVELGLLSRHLEQALAERTRELREANSALKRLAMDISQIEAFERERLAGELHDSPMQKLALAQAQIVSAARHRDAESDEQLEVGLELMRDALRELRSLQFELSPPVLRQEGLAPALRWLASDGTRRLGVKVSFDESGNSDGLDYDLAVVLFRCAWELVHNLAKHAKASEGRIALKTLSDEMELTVSDDGTGFPKEANSGETNAPGGYGLFSVRERIMLLGGSLSIDSTAGGTCISIRVPRATGPRRRRTDRPIG